jgi:hypothetical protein
MLSFQSTTHRDTFHLSAVLCVRLLAVLTAYALIYYAWRISLPLQLDVNEPWNAWHAMRYANGLPLYPTNDALIANNYPPLSFMLIGTLARFGVSPVLAGRLLSLIAVPVIGLCIYASVRCLGGQRLGGAVAALWYLTSMMVGGLHGYIGMNDPNLLALAIMSVGLWAFLRADGRAGAVTVSLAVMVVAGFFKHNLFAIPLTCVVWQLFGSRVGAARNTLLSAMPIVVAASLVGLGILACIAVFGWTFVDQLMMPRVVSGLRAFTGWEFLPWEGLSLAVVFLLSAPLDRHRRFLALFLVGSFVLFMAQKTGHGVARNAQFELQIAVALSVGLAVAWLQALANSRDRYAALAPLVLPVFVLKAVVMFGLGPLPKPLSHAYAADIQDRVARTTREIERVKRLPSNVVCPTQLVCFLARKPFLYDAFAIDQRVLTGTWTQARRDAAIADTGLVFIETDPRATWPR